MQQIIDTNDIFFIFASFLYVLFIGHIGVYYVVKKMWSILQIETNESKLKSRLWQGVVTGAIDRALFVIALLMGKPDFIALWLGLKTVSQYKRWSEDETGRATFNIFLAGNGLSLLYVVATYGLVILEKGIWTLIIAGGPILFSIFIYIYLIYYEELAVPD